MYNVHCTIYSVHCTNRAVIKMEYNLHYLYVLLRLTIRGTIVFPIDWYILNTLCTCVYCVRNVHCVPVFIVYSVYTIRLYDVQCTPYTIYWYILHTLLHKRVREFIVRTMYIVRVFIVCAMYTIRLTRYDVQCTPYTNYWYILHTLLHTVQYNYSIYCTVYAQ